MKYIRYAVLIMTALFIFGMSIYISNQPTQRLPRLMTVTIIVVIGAVAAALYLGRKAR